MLLLLTRHCPYSKTTLSPFYRPRKLRLEVVSYTAAGVVVVMVGGKELSMTSLVSSGGPFQSAFVLDLKHEP